MWGARRESGHSSTYDTFVPPFAALHQITRSRERPRRRRVNEVPGLRKYAPPMTAAALFPRRACVYITVAWPNHVAGGSPHRRRRGCPAAVRIREVSPRRCCQSHCCTLHIVPLLLNSRRKSAASFGHTSTLGPLQHHESFFFLVATSSSHSSCAGSNELY